MVIYTTIRIKKKALSELSKFKIHKNQAIDEVIDDLIKKAKKNKRGKLK